MDKTLVSLFDNVSSKSDRLNKITVVGVGQVGMAAAYTIMMKGLCRELALVDIVEDKLKGEMMDMQQCQQFMTRCNVVAGSDYAVSAKSDIVVITAGARQREGESRLNLVQRNVDIFKGMIPKIVQNSPDCIIVVVSNPVDVLSYVAWKLSGFPQERVFGTGTMLDSARFRYMLGEKLGVSTSSCQGLILGEHGDSSVAVWSGVNVAGQSLAAINKNIGKDGDPDDFAAVHRNVIASAYDIIKLKGYTSWAIGATVASLCNAILHDENEVIPLSVRAKDKQGIHEDVFISLPAVVTRAGVKGTVAQPLNEDENKALQASVKQLHGIIDGISW